MWSEKFLHRIQVNKVFKTFSLIKFLARFIAVVIIDMSGLKVQSVGSIV